MLVHTNTSIQLYSNAGELLAAQINGGMLMVLYAVAVIIFVGAKYKNGFIKNIANQLPRRELLVFPEIIVSSVACAFYFLHIQSVLLLQEQSFLEIHLSVFLFFPVCYCPALAQLQSYTCTKYMTHYDTFSALRWEGHSLPLCPSPYVPFTFHLIYFFLFLQASEEKETGAKPFFKDSVPVFNVLNIVLVQPE